MKHTLTNITRICLLIPAIGLLIISCSDNPISSEVKSNEISFSSEQISWIPWKPEYLEEKNSLNRVFVGQWISAATGGTVGGDFTYNNQAWFPSGAVLEDTYISLEVIFTDEIFGQYAGGIEFLPSMQFELDITVTMSYAYLDYAGDPADLIVYWSNDSGASWYIVNEVLYDAILETATFQVDHFTVFAWGEEPPGGE
ncbi:MAG: hypothetical protein H8E14_18235 [Candidatus Marinimicrobia bacterium]|nr:hypothetical protein [Candidatus Neomarinimicrobiota bacterium]